jgi:hypothetical protein
MDRQIKPERDIDSLPIYEIRLPGRLDKDWSDWLDGMSITYEGDVTVLRGQVVDQAALRGILSKIWDLNRTVISIRRITLGG